MYLNSPLPIDELFVRVYQYPNAFHHKLQKKTKTDMLNMLMRLLGSLSWAAEIRID